MFERLRYVVAQQAEQARMDLQGTNVAPRWKMPEEDLYISCFGVSQRI